MMFYMKQRQYRTLPHVDRAQWRVPSAAQPKDQFGNDGVRVRFCLTAWLDDGHPLWSGAFESREDADAFLYALARATIGEPMGHADASLPTPWFDPDLVGREGVSYQFLTQVILTTSGSNQTYTSPSDWNNSNNTIYTFGGGASGAYSKSAHATGGGGGGSNKTANFSFATPGTTTATYRVAALVAGPTVDGTNGTVGNDTWFNGTTLALATVGSKGGSGGAQGAGSRTGGAGGVSSSGRGTTLNNGGAGGNLTGASGTGGSGGGGCAGITSVGTSGSSSSSTGAAVTTAGGAGGSTSLGAGGAGGSTAGQNGTAGTNLDGSNGTGGGGAGNAVGGTGSGGNGAITALAAVGSMPSAGPSSGGSGSQGVIYIEYTPGGIVPLGLPLMGL